MADCYVGEIRLFAGARNEPPANWMFCEGQSLSVNNYQLLFSLLGTTYGGDGVTAFKLPDMRGRAPIHVGQGLNLTNRVLGIPGGNEAVTLGIAQIPVHNHPFNVSGDKATSALPDGLVLANADPREFYATQQLSGSSPQVLQTDTVSLAGGNQPHENRMPSIALHYIIATNGTYPNFQD